MKRLGVFPLPLDRMLVHCRVSFPPALAFTGTHLCPWPDGGIVRGKYLAQEHNTMTVARDQAVRVKPALPHSQRLSSSRPRGIWQSSALQPPVDMTTLLL